ncbi:MAG: hypothetical protein GWM92_01845 [Gemmatimonadetes bacterium]|nr:hypothetical protein [Gemmatimonadota bacterium]NIR77225.1 hypothetical protein [Gemmatimonadota bacterium]NIT85742.1 hypothetical protein [Gemmatimonadota bacterium]NIU29569.1 hypothetical protein [Gemmatimonadota bacterium]NIU34618.1 hypothetical protein [Gemmatimonadota bacterium]
MQPFVRGFIRSSLVWLVIGLAIGISMAFAPGSHLVYRPAHVHANLLGFVSMMIFGVAYHVMPRFAGRPLPSRRLPATHLWLANGGLALMVGGWLLRPHLYAPGNAALLVGTVLTTVGIAFFVWTIWKTVGGPPVGIDVPGPLTRKRPPLVQEDEG